eukprot:5583008-Prorocentrum_lima.AAC.1
MTSSLVGSEMCIRDRTVPLQGDRKAKWGDAQEEAHQNAKQWQTYREEAPVSYTHLTLPTICSV